MMIVACGIVLLSLMMNEPHHSTVQHKETLRILALGDSYTIGESVEPHERFPDQLAAALRSRGLAVAELVVLARTGWTTDELNAAIDEHHPTGTFDLVTLLIGVNNQYRGRSVDEYRLEFVALLQRAIAFAGMNPRRVLVLSIPDWGVMPFADGRDRAKISLEIDAFNAVNWEESVRAGAQYIDITPISREAQRLPDLIAPDGLHPSAVQYAAWVALIVPKALKALSHSLRDE